MIARTWFGTTLPDRGDDYVTHLETTVLPEIRRIEGHRGAFVLRSGNRFQVITLWDSMDAIRRFAGNDLETAVVPPEARALMAEFDEHVSHFDVVHTGV